MEDSWRLTQVQFSKAMKHEPDVKCYVYFFKLLKWPLTHLKGIEDKQIAFKWKSEVDNHFLCLYMWVSFFTCAAPRGGTLSLFMAFWRSPPSSSVVTRAWAHKGQRSDSTLQFDHFCPKASFSPSYHSAAEGVYSNTNTIWLSYEQEVKSLNVETGSLPRSQRWAVWSSYRCRMEPPPREPHANRLHAVCPESYHVS